MYYTQLLLAAILGVGIVVLIGLHAVEKCLSVIKLQQHKQQRTLEQIADSLASIETCTSYFYRCRDAQIR